MSPLGQAVARWLRTFPGPIQGDTHDECVAAALAASGLAKHNVTTTDLQQALDRAGYKPEQRRRHGSDDGATYWLYVLPEKPFGA